MTGGMACVLFTDLVGSTELMSRLGDAAFDELRDGHFARLRSAVEAHDGALVKTTGDGILATFRSAADALAAAVAAQQAAECQGHTAGVPLDLRVGLALGEVAEKEGDVFGTPVVEAARLVAAARPGQILCSAVVRTVAGSRAAVEFADLGHLELKGLPEPLPVCEVAWAPVPDTATSVPLPGLLTGTGRIFVGRDGEQERLRQLWKETAAGERRVALLGGEPGIGKTRLAAQLAAELHGQGALVLAGRCDEDLGVPYQPFVEALRHYVTHAPEPRLGRHGGELARIVPELPDLVPGLPEPLRSDPETERYRLFDAVASWLADASAETPVLLILDDIQWAAKPTLLLLRHVLRSAEPARLLCLATYRDTDIGRGHPLTELLADLRRDDGSERLPVTGLDASGVAAFMEAAAGHGLDEDGEDLARAVWAETEGNPFFMVEIIRHLAEAGALEQREGRWVVSSVLDDVGIPEGVRDVVGRRLSRLSEAANQALTVAAVVGLEFEPAVVAAAAGMEEDDLLAGVEEAVAARLVVEAGGPVPRYRFSHTLIRATLYDEVTAGRRVVLHRKVGEAIEAVHGHHLDDHLPALALHWARASAPAAEVGKAVDYATRAGNRALAQLAHDEAASYYAQAVELLDAAGEPADGPARVDLLIALGEAQRRAGDAIHRETLLTASHLAEIRADAGQLARAALANTRGHIFTRVGAVDPEKVAALEGALAATREVDTTVRAQLLATLALELTFAGEWQRCLTLSDEALAIARRLDDPETLVRVFSARYFLSCSPDLMTGRLAETAELLSVAERVTDPRILGTAHALRARAAFEAGDIEEADQCFEAADVLTAELEPALRWRVLYSRVGFALAAGQLDEAEAQARAMHEMGASTGQPDGDWLYAIQLAVIRHERGSGIEEVIPLLRSAFETIDVPAFRILLAVMCSDVGRDDEVQLELRHVSARGLSRDLYWLGGNCWQAELAYRHDDREHAQELVSLLEPHAWVAVSSPTPIPSPSVAHHLGLLATTLGRLDEAGAYFARAADIHQRLGSPNWLARTRMEWASAILRGGDVEGRERARVLLDQAVATAVDLGLAGVERRSRQLLSEAGA
jgi:class 3 adenylate cyclase/tetratricopeptide (TPR) repeat protein